MFDDEFINNDERIVHMDASHKYFFYGEGDNPRAGIFYIHLNKSGDWCSVPLDIKPADDEPEYEGKAWHVVDNDYDNLSLVPSIICTHCGSHGYIVDNKWEDPFAEMPDVPIEWILSECVPGPYNGKQMNWPTLFNGLNGVVANERPKIKELIESYNQVGEFWNPVVIQGGVVVEGKVRLTAAIIMGLKTFQVHFLPDKDDENQEDQVADVPAAVS